MGGSRSWTTPSHRIFLFSQLEEYKVAQSKGCYTDFWPGLYEKWENMFPTLEEKFPGRELTSLTEEEHAKLKKDIQDRRDQLQSWYRWKCNKRGRNAQQSQTKLDKELLSSRTRLPQESEVYTKLCYKEKIKPVAEARWKEQKVSTSGAKLRVVNEVARELLDKEEPEVKEQVKAAVVDLQVKREAAAHSPWSAEDYAQSINESPAVLGHFLRALAEKTGWAYTVLMGGPDPAATNGEISVASFHVGETAMGHTFGQAHPKFETTFMDPYSDFLQYIYAPQTRQARCGKDAPKGGEGGVGVKELQSSGLFIMDDVASPSTPPNNALTILSPNANAPHTAGPSGASPFQLPMPGQPVDAMTVINAPPLLPTRSQPFDTVVNAPPNITAPHNLGASVLPSTEIPSPLVFSANPASSLPSINDLEPFDFRAFDFETLDLTNLDFGPSGLESLQLTHKAGWPTSPEFAGGFIGLSGLGLMDELNSGLQAAPEPNMCPPCAIPLPERIFEVNAYAPPTIIPAVAVPSPTPTSPVPPMNVSLVTAPISSVGHMTTLPVTTPSPTPAKPMSISPAQPPIPLPPTAPTGLNLVNISQDSGCTISSVDPMNILPITAPSPTSVEPMDVSPAQPLTPVPPVVPTVLNPVTVSRYSGRAIVPSTRAEIMNKIGSKAKSNPTLDPSDSNKENYPPNTVQLPPPWLLAAKAYLTANDFGNEWSDCIKVWLRFEAHFGYTNKKPMPLVSLRPEEWSAWIAKSRNGVRSYDQIPAITSPPEFGIAIMKWWCAIQPPFRQSANSPTPLPIYDNPDEPNCWEALQRGGPNGMLSMLTLLSWWGLSQKSTSQWEEDTEVQWVACVVDFRRVLERITSGKKRGASSSTGAVSKKAKV